MMRSAERLRNPLLAYGMEQNAHFQAQPLDAYVGRIVRPEKYFPKTFVSKTGGGNSSRLVILESSRWSCLPRRLIIPGTAILGSENTFSHSAGRDCSPSNSITESRTSKNSGGSFHLDASRVM